MPKPRGKPIKQKKARGAGGIMQSAATATAFLVPGLPPLDQAERQALNRAVDAFLKEAKIVARPSLALKARQAIIIWGLRRKDELRILELKKRSKGSKTRLGGGEQGHIDKALRRAFLRETMNYTDVRDALIRIAGLAEKLRSELEIVAPTLGMVILKHLLYPNYLDHIDGLPQAQRLSASMKASIDLPLYTLPSRLAVDAGEAAKWIDSIPSKAGRPVKGHHHAHLVGALADIYSAGGHTPTVIRRAREGEHLSPFCESLRAMWQEIPQALQCDFNTLLVHAEKVILTAKSRCSQKS